MKRFALTLVFCAGASAALWADEPSPKPTLGPAPPKKAAGQPAAVSAAAARKRVAAQLAAPADLDFDGRTSVTLAEFLDEIRSRHQLSIRFDAPVFAMLYGSAEIGESAAQVNHGDSVASALFNKFLLSNDVSTRATCPNPGCQPRSNGPPPSVVGAPPTYVPGSSDADKSIATGSDAPAALAVRTASAESEGADAAEQPSSGAPAPPAAAGPSVPVPPSAPSSAPAESPRPPAVIPQTVPEESHHSESAMSLARLLELPLSTHTIDLKAVSVAAALRYALDAASAAGPQESATGMPILLTEAMLLDTLIEDGGVLITTRVEALTRKETRVYSLKRLSEIPQKELVVVIQRSIRPWSWRSQIDDLGNHLKAGGGLIPAKLIASLGQSGLFAATSPPGGNLVPAFSVQQVGDSSEDQSAPSVVNSPALNMPEGVQFSAKEMELIGQGLTNLLTASLHTSLNVTEMFHYADPPTGSIQVLPGKLIILQSQAAHREIEELLEQLAEE